jgi:predicted O-methyltransferase YrrM
MDDALEVLKDIESRAGQSGWPIIGAEKGVVLEESVRKYRPKRVVEVGACVGYSAILMGRHLPPGGRIQTIEIDPKAAQLTRENLARAGLADRVEVIVGDAVQEIPRLSGSVDMAFIDAEKTGYLSYLKLLEDKLHPGSVVVADNVKIFAAAVKDYLDYVRTSGRYDSEFFDFPGDAVEVSIRK